MAQNSTGIAAFAAAMTAFFERQDKAVADIQTEMDNLNNDIKTLQDSAGQITPEDQATLDAIQARASKLSDQIDAMDTLTPPAPPVADPAPTT